jgi:hypothetical protein
MSETPAYDLLVADASGHRKHWVRYVRFYGFLYPCMRVSLIVATAIVAAKDTFAGSPLEPLAQWVSFIALLVAIGTSLDTWMKPAVRWQAAEKARDDYELLEEDLKALPDGAKSDRPLIVEFQERRKKIKAEARATYVF